MESRKLTDSRLKMTPVVILQRLATDLNGRSSWRTILNEHPPAQSSCTSVPMSLPFYRRQRQASISASEEQSSFTERKNVQKYKQRTKRASRSLPRNKFSRQHLTKECTSIEMDTESVVSTAESVPNSQAPLESGVRDTAVQNQACFSNSNSEETTSSKERSPSPAETAVLTEQSGELSVNSSDTEIDESAVYDTSLSQDSNDTIAVAVPAELLTDVETDTDVESRRTGDSIQCHSLESSQSTVLSDSEKQEVTEIESLSPTDVGKKCNATNMSDLHFQTDSCDKSATRTKDYVSQDRSVASASPEQTSTVPLTACTDRISAEDEIDAFTADVIETMLDVHASSLPTFAHEYFHHFEECLAVMYSMQESDRNMYAKALCGKRHSLRRIFQLFKELRHFVDYSPLETIATVERQFSNLLSAAYGVMDVRDVEPRANVQRSADGLPCRNIQANAGVSERLLLQNHEHRSGISSSSAAGYTNDVRAFTNAGHVHQRTVQPFCDSSPLNRASSCPTQPPFSPHSSPCSEVSGHTVQPSSPVVESRVAYNTPRVQNAHSTNANQRQQSRAASAEPNGSSSYPAISHTVMNNPGTSNAVVGSNCRPFTLVVQGATSLSQATEAARKIMLSRISSTTTTTASQMPLHVQRQLGSPQSSSPTTRIQSYSTGVPSTSCVVPEATSNTLSQASLNSGGNPGTELAHVPASSLAHSIPLQPRGQPPPVHTFGVHHRAPVALSTAAPFPPPVRWAPQGLLFVPSQGQATNCTAGFISSPQLPTNLGQNYIRNSWPRPSLSNFAVVLPPMGTVNQQVRSSVINIQTPVAVMPAAQAVMQSVESATQLQNRSAVIGPPSPTISQARPCITGVVIPVVRSAPEGSALQNSSICSVQDVSRNRPNLLPRGDAQNTKPSSVDSCQPLTPHVVMGHSR